MCRTFSAPLGRSKPSCSNGYFFDSLVSYPLLHLKQESAHQLLGLEKTPCCRGPVRNLRVTSVLLLVLKAADAKMGLDMQKTCWENVYRRNNNFNFNNSVTNYLPLCFPVLCSYGCCPMNHIVFQLVTYGFISP